MNTLQLIIVCLTVVALAVIIASHLSVKKGKARLHLEDLVGNPVVVNTIDQRSIRGVMVEAAGGYVAVGEPTYSEGGDERKMMGAAHVPVSNIAFVQDTLHVRTDASNDR